MRTRRYGGRGDATSCEARERCVTGRGFVHIRAIKPWSVAGFVGIGTLISLIDEQHAGLPALPTLTVTEAADQSPMSDCRSKARLHRAPGYQLGA